MANKERKDLNTTNGDLGNDYATSSVPISQRRGFFGTAMVWVGWCISLSAFLTGGTIGAGNTLWIGLLAVLAGNLLLFVLGSLCGVIGSAPVARRIPCLSRCSAARAPSSYPYCAALRP